MVGPNIKCCDISIGSGQSRLRLTVDLTDRDHAGYACTDTGHAGADSERGNTLLAFGLYLQRLRPDLAVIDLSRNIAADSIGI